MEQGSTEWFEARLGKVTASRIADVMMAKTAAGYQNYMAHLICERLTGEPVETFKSAAMEHGTETEPQARAMYEMETGSDVTECGFIPHPKLTNSGASPDGLILDIGLVEIKCPQPAKHVKNLMGGKIDRLYMLQMQWQMACAERGWCDFVSFNPSFPPHLQLSITRVDAEPETQEEITAAVTTFLAEMDANIRALESRAAA